MLLWLFYVPRMRMRLKEIEAEGERIHREAEHEGRKIRADKERELSRREAELHSLSERLEAKQQGVEDAEKWVDKEKERLSARKEEIKRLQHEAEKYARLYRMRLHSMQDWDEDRAREAAIEEARKECEREIRQMRSAILGKTEAELEEEANKVLLAAMQRIATNPANETSATIVTLKSEQMKGRIIGREGRNIRSFEAVTGTTLMIDESPDSVLVSSFDPVRREIAKMALEALMKDGRINPATIEETVENSRKEIKKTIRERGEKALKTLRLSSPSTEIVELIGKLHYRLSNNQNTLDHSIEVGFISSLLAAELGLDQALAKRAGLFHDMGKSVGHEYEGSHASVAAEILKQNDEDPRIVNAVAAHHGEVPDESVYAGLLKVADALSAIRPGARTDSMESYIQRVKNLEEVALKMEGVVEAYAIQAGREVRVIVSPEKVSDAEAKQLSLALRQRIEEELNFPGSIKITVIREQRFQEMAK